MMMMKNYQKEAYNPAASPVRMPTVPATINPNLLRAEFFLPFRFVLFNGL